MINYLEYINEEKAKVAKLRTPVKKLTAKIACTILSVALYEYILQFLPADYFLMYCTIFSLLCILVFFSDNILSIEQDWFFCRYLCNFTLAGMHDFNISLLALFFQCS